MSCIICLTSANAERACSCTALACRGCLLEILDRGKERCVVCGSRWHPQAVVHACLSGLEGPTASQDAKAYVKLAVAYSAAEDPRRALRSLAIAQHLVEPESRWDHFIKVETGQNLLAIGLVDDAERCLRGVMPRLLQLPRRAPSGVLFAACCVLLCKTNSRKEKLGPARAWLRRALNIQADLGLQVPLATSLQMDASLLMCQGKYHIAKKTLQSAERILSRFETDECLKACLQLQIADVETKLNECGPARARLAAVLPMLRRRKHDHFVADVLPTAACALSKLVNPSRRLRRKTCPECVEHRESQTASQP